jgi:mediator of RNA polymerase II transcription subunit 27
MVSANFKATEGALNTLNVPSGPFTLGNTAFLNYETELERQQMYNELVKGYHWYEKTHQYSAIANTMLQHNSLKRSYYSTSNKRRRLMTNAHSVPPKIVDQIIGTISVNNMTLKIYRPFATNAFLHVNNALF